MPTPAAVVPARRLPHVITWIATLLLALPVFAAGLPKLLGQGGWITAFAHWGYPGWLVPVVGTAEVLGVVLLFVPRVASVGATMIAVIMAGAAVTHAAHGETPRVAFTVALCVLAVVVASVRRRSLGVPLLIGSRPRRAAGASE